MKKVKIKAIANLKYSNHAFLRVMKKENKQKVRFEGSPEKNSKEGFKLKRKRLETGDLEDVKNIGNLLLMDS